MPDKELYALIVPERGLTDTQSRASQQQAIQALLGSDTGNVESIASDPGERPVTVEYVDEYAEVRAQELRELASGLSQPLPYHAVGGRSPDDRYVTVASGDVGPVDPRSGKAQRATISLRDVGTRASHWREVRTAPTQPDHPFGNSTEAPVGVPAAASKVRWYDRETRETAEPTVQTTRSSRLGDVDILDATAAPFDRPSVIFDVEYALEGETDPRAFDTRGHAEITDENGALRWAKVFTPSHLYRGQAIITNGLLRLTIDEAAGTISAERWDAGTSSWTDEALGDSDWEVFDADLRTIGLAQVGGKVEFVDTTQSPTQYHTLGMQLARGNEDVLWTTESGVPGGLQTLLEPIAAEHIYDPFGSLQSAPQRLRAREEVN